MTDEEDRKRKEIARFHTLRDDAIARGFKDAALVYGWTAMRLYHELIVIHGQHLGTAPPTD